MFQRLGGELSIAASPFLSSDAAAGKLRFVYAVALIPLHVPLPNPAPICRQEAANFSYIIN
jgi:hypothetical protein